VIVRLAPLPPSERPDVGRSAGLELVALATKLASGVSVSETIKATVSEGVGLVIICGENTVEMLGGLLMGAGFVTKKKPVRALRAPSETVSRTEAVPIAIGVNVTVRAVPVPLNAIPLKGRTAGLLVSAESARAAIAVSLSFTVTTVETELAPCAKV
jgi:hypothetical protein